MLVIYRIQDSNEYGRPFWTRIRPNLSFKIRFGLGFGRILISKQDSDSAKSKILDLVDHFKIFEFYLNVCQKLNEM